MSYLIGGIMNKKGSLAIVPLIIGVVVAVLVATALFPTIWNAIESPSGNTTPYSSTVGSMLDLAPLFIALAIGLVGVVLIYKTMGKH